MTKAMVRRVVHTYDLPLPAGTTLLHPELTVLKLGQSRTIDVGLLCYKQRTMPDTTTRKGGRRVAVESFDVDRVEPVRRLILHISSYFEHSGLRAETLHSRFTRLLAFLNWADVQGCPDVLANERNARTAFTSYAAYIRDRVARNEISLNSGAKQQLGVAHAIGEFHEIDDFERGFNLLRKDAKTAEVTSPPSEELQAKVLAVCTSLFDGLCSFVLEKHSYPYLLAMPAYLGLPSNCLWIFPGTSWFKTPEMLANSQTNAGYNFSDGRLSTAEELQVEYPTGKTTHRWQDVQRDARRQIEKGNTDFNHNSRWYLASHALSAYAILFLAATGMNWAQLTGLLWENDKYEIETPRQGFRTIKWRAAGKLVSFELPIVALPAFKRFLELRHYVLQGRACDYLFFRSATAAAPAIPYVSGLHTIYKVLNRIDPSLNMISPREWRAAKSDWLVRNTDPATAALVLQNTEKTVLQSYAEGSETRHLEEMGAFLGQVANVVVARDEPIDGATVSSVGVCAAYGKPVAMSSNAPVTPNCRGPEGCLFCDKLKVHADERDTRKLLSCCYCIRLVTPTESSFENTQEALQPILDRIGEILDEIAERDPEMVLRVSKEVDEEGELDAYWAGKFNMLMSLMD